MDKKILKYIFIFGVAAGAIAAVIAIISSGKNRETDMTGPEEVMKTFCKAVATGDFDTAWSVCDTLSMADYMDRSITAWEEASRKDSLSAEIARGILEKSDIIVENIERKEGGRYIDYTIKAPDGAHKKKSAVLIKGGEGWIVKDITDR